MKKTYEMYISDGDRTNINNEYKHIKLNGHKTDTFKHKVTITIEEPEEKKLIEKLEYDDFTPDMLKNLWLKQCELIDIYNQLHNKTEGRE